MISSTRTIWLNTSTLRVGVGGGGGGCACARDLPCAKDCAIVRGGFGARASRVAGRAGQLGSPGLPLGHARQQARQTAARAANFRCAAGLGRAADSWPPTARWRAAPPRVAHLCPVCLSRVSSLSSRTILPDVTTSRVATLSSPTALSRYSSCARHRESQAGGCSVSGAPPGAGRASWRELHGTAGALAQGGPGRGEAAQVCGAQLCMPPPHRGIRAVPLEPTAGVLTSAD